MLVAPRRCRRRAGASRPNAARLPSRRHYLQRFFQQVAPFRLRQNARRRCFRIRLRNRHAFEQLRPGRLLPAERPQKSSAALANGLSPAFSRRSASSGRARERRLFALFPPQRFQRRARERRLFALFPPQRFQRTTSPTPVQDFGGRLGFPLLAAHVLGSKAARGLQAFQPRFDFAACRLPVITMHPFRIGFHQPEGFKATTARLLRIASRYSNCVGASPA